MSNFKRKKKLINKSLQLKMVAVFGIVGCTCALFQVVLVNFSLLEIARNATSGGDEILKAARGMMLENVLWTFFAMLPLMTCVGIIVTHRVAGPAYRMTEHCKSIAAGGEIGPCKIRDGDELQEMCAALNSMIERLAPSAADTEAEGTSWELEDQPTLIAEEAATEAEAESESASESAPAAEVSSTKQAG